MNAAQLRRHAVNQLSVWLPVLVMAIFALATWWLVRSAPKPEEARIEKIDDGHPDYFMEHFAIRRFEADGAPRATLAGEHGEHYPVSDTLRVRQPRLLATTRIGLLTTAQAQRSHSDSAGKEVQLFDRAVVIREAGTDNTGRQQPRLQFRGDHLHVFVDEDRVRAEKPVELTREPDIFTGDRLDYSDKTGIALLSGHVHGILQSQSLRQPSPATPSAPRVQ